MYNSIGVQSALAVTGIGVLSYVVGAWVLILAGVVILSLVKRKKKTWRN